jgi:predicted amidohydrolase YtcJ
MNDLMYMSVKSMTLYRSFRPIDYISGFRRRFQFMLGIFFVSQILVISAYAQTDELPEELIQYADFVFTNGQVLTANADKDFTIAEAVAVRGSHILAVGSDEKIKRYAGPHTRRIDLQGRSLTPGFIYTNSDNAVTAGDILKDSQWNGMIQPHVGGDSLDQALLTMSTIIEQEAEPGEPIFFNLYKEWSGPASNAWDKSTLDEIAPNNPVIVYLLSSEGIVNEQMIELALKSGFPKDHFHLDRDEQGQYTGRAGSDLVGFIGREVRPWPSPEWFDNVAEPEAREMFTEWSRHGVTMAVGHMSGLTITALNKMFHDGDGRDLAIRVYPGLDFLRQNPEGEKYLKRLGNLVDFALIDDRGPMVKIIGTSVGPHSGAPNAFNGLLTIEPKKNIIPELGTSEHGLHRWATEWFDTGVMWEDLTPEQKAKTDYRNVMLARQHGWNLIGIHNMGSEAIRFTMQLAYEAEQQEKKYVENLWRPHGFIHNIDWVPEVYDYWESHPEIHGLLHFSITLRTGINQRDAGPLGINNVIEAQYGMEGLERMTPLRTLHEKGIPFHIEGSYPGRRGEDWPTYNIHKGVMRYDDQGRRIAPEQGLDREAAFLATTRWVARYAGALDEVGSIETGKLADLVVFNGNIMDVPIEKLPDLLPVMTMVGGWIAYEDPAGEL